MPFLTVVKNQLELEFFSEEGFAGPVRRCPRFRDVELRFSYVRLSPLVQKRAPQLLWNRVHFLWCLISQCASNPRQIANRAPLSPLRRALATRRCNASRRC